MNEFLAEWKSIALGLLAAIVGLLTWIGNRLQGHVDELRQTAVTREELRDALAEIKAERQQMHQENRETLARIHERVDDLWQRGP